MLIIYVISGAFLCGAGLIMASHLVAARGSRSR
jgi:hypothetical protein